jgi:hypothetical protein
MNDLLAALFVLKRLENSPPAALGYGWIYAQSISKKGCLLSQMNRYQIFVS